MGKKATKAADSMYCQARYEASENNSDFESREKAHFALSPSIADFFEFL